MNKHTGQQSSTKDVDPAVAVLVQRHAPVILFDTLEPIMPTAVGYNVYHADDQSISARHTRRSKLGAAETLDRQ